MAFEKVTRKQDYSKWYNNLVEDADLAQHSSVRGCMVIKPYGYAIWEKMQAELDRMFKETGHSNAYFPLFVPKSMLPRYPWIPVGYSPTGSSNATIATSRVPAEVVPMR